MKTLVTFLSLLSIVSTAHADDSAKSLYPNMYKGFNAFNVPKCEETDRYEKARLQVSLIPGATEIKVFAITPDSSTLMGTLAEDIFLSYSDEHKQPMWAKVAVTKAGCITVDLEITKRTEEVKK